MPRTEFPIGRPRPEWSPIQARLEELGIPEELQRELQGKLRGTFEGLLLYGSWARGDAGEASDLDVLALTYSGVIPNFGGRVSFSTYSEDQLRESSETLFGHHLARDGIVLSDPDGLLASLLSKVEPPKPGSVHDRIRTLTPVLDVTSEDEVDYLEGLTKVVRYLVRSALYAEALDAGEPCYSVREIAERKRDPALVELLSSHRGS